MKWLSIHCQAVASMYMNTKLMSLISDRILHWLWLMTETACQQSVKFTIMNDHNLPYKFHHFTDGDEAIPYEFNVRNLKHSLLLKLRTMTNQMFFIPLCSICLSFSHFTFQFLNFQGAILQNFEIGPLTMQKFEADDVNTSILQRSALKQWTKP